MEDSVLGVVPTNADASFERLDSSTAGDLDVVLKECPTSTTTRGTFFQFLVASVEKNKRAIPAGLFDGVETRRWVSWGSYPLVDFIRLAGNAVRILHSDLSRGEGLRRLGWMAYPSFAATMAGRVVLIAFGDDADALMQVVPKAYAVTLPDATVTSKRIGKNHWEIGMRNAYNFADCYHAGVIEGGLRARGVEPVLKVRRYPHRCDIDFDVQW
jgi:uncharacterized protein (TIGR02265 family)